VSVSWSFLPEASPPDRIGPYRLLELLGQGAMGRVYRARDEALDRDVALKILAPGRGDHAALARFRREAEAASRVRHRHLVTVHAFGEADGVPYLVLDLVRGRSLAEAAAAGPLEPGEAVRIAGELASALGALHAGGVLHRDLKPANVLLTEDGAAKLSDLGLARLDDATRLTQSAAVVGTPTYMAPEQLRGAPVDARADVYALGAILYELLSGQPPVRARTVAELLAAKHAAPRPLSVARPGLGVDLERVCRRALAVDPAERYPSAEALAADLDRVARGEPVADLDGRRRRTRRRVAVGVLALVLAGGAAGVGGLPGGPPPVGERLAALDAERVERVAASGSLGDVDLAPVASALAALPAEALAADPAAEATAEALWAWVGLAALARDDEAAAEAALARSGPDGGHAAAALRGGLALAAGAPEAACAALSPPVRRALPVPEPARWWARARFAAGVAERAEAETVRVELGRLRRAGFDLGAAGHALAARCAAVTGDRRRAEAALGRLPKPPPGLAWEVALLAVADDVRAGAFEDGLARLDGLTPPSGAASPTATALARRVIEPAAQVLDALGPRRPVTDAEVFGLAPRFRLYGRLAPGVARPEARRERLLELLTDSMTELPSHLIQAIAAAYPEDADVAFYIAARGSDADYSRTASGFEPAARRALALATPERRPHARLFLARVLVTQGAAREARAQAEALLAELEAGAPGMEPDLRRDVEGEARLIRARARRALGDPAGALTDLTAADRLHTARSDEVTEERILTLIALDRRADAFEVAHASCEAPGVYGKRRRSIAGLAWQLGEQLERWEALAEVLGPLEELNVVSGIGWAMRRAIVAWARGRTDEAAVAVEGLMARSLALREALPDDVPARLAAGDPDAFAALREAERTLSARAGGRW